MNKNIPEIYLINPETGEVKKKLTLEEIAYYSGLVGMILDKFLGLPKEEQTKILNERRRDFIPQDLNFLHSSVRDRYHQTWSEFVRILPLLRVKIVK